jgi:hypothetical protein
MCAFEGDKLDKILERQRMTQFDTVMLLAYPLTILGVQLALGSPAWSIASTSTGGFLGFAYALAFALSLGRMIVVPYFVIGAVLYAFAFLNDNFLLRMFAVFLWTFALCVCGAASLLLRITELVSWAVVELWFQSFPPQILEALVFVLYVCAGFAIFALSSLGVLYVINWMIRWFTRNVPKQFSTLRIGKTALKLPHLKAIFLILWYAILLPSYAASVVSTINQVGPKADILWDYSLLWVSIVASVLPWARRPNA